MASNKAVMQDPAYTIFINNLLTNAQRIGNEILNHMTQSTPDMRIYIKVTDPANPRVNFPGLFINLINPRIRVPRRNGGPGTASLQYAHLSLHTYKNNVTPGKIGAFHCLNNMRAGVQRYEITNIGTATVNINRIAPATLANALTRDFETAVITVVATYLIPQAAPGGPGGAGAGAAPGGPAPAAPGGPGGPAPAAPGGPGGAGARAAGKTRRNTRLAGGGETENEILQEKYMIIELSKKDDTTVQVYVEFDEKNEKVFQYDKKEVPDKLVDNILMPYIDAMDILTDVKYLVNDYSSESNKNVEKSNEPENRLNKSDPLLKATGGKRRKTKTRKHKGRRN